ncbi:MAG: hypothetical protein SaVV1_gp2 [Sanya virga-like virus 1]|nr:MAG: hypothetical protein SaVV1_gp2 [Sanya virga-like virus 1]
MCINLNLLSLFHFNLQDSVDYLIVKGVFDLLTLDFKLDLTFEYQNLYSSKLSRSLRSVVISMASPKSAKELNIVGYHNWTDGVNLFVSREFVNAADLVKLLNSVRRKNFSVKSVREEILGALNSLERVSIATPSSRMDDVVYADLTVGALAILMDRLFLCLDDKGNDRKVSDDVRLSYVKIISRMLEILVDSDFDRACCFGLVTRDYFECKFQLVWVDA